MDAKAKSEDSEAWHLTDDLHVEQGKGDPFAAAMRATRMPMLITNPRLPDNPIVFANEAFLKLSGYDRDEVVGQNCRFLQGPDTDPKSVSAIRDAVAARRDVAIDILNYRKDGTTFWNALFISPVANEKGELQFFFASQLDVSDRKLSEGRAQREKDRFERAVKERTKELEAALEAKTVLLHEVDHRVKNNLQMISSLIVMQLRKIPDESIRQSLTSMLERVEALSTVHRRLYQSDDVSRFDVGDFVRDLTNDLIAANPGRARAELDLDVIEIPAEKATPVALIVSELVTNALKHAFDQETEGLVEVSVKRVNGIFRIIVADNGTGMPADAKTNTFGATLIKALSRQLRADVQWGDNSPGTKVIVTLPVENTAAGD